MIEINGTNLYLDYPAIMFCESINENTFSHKKMLQRRLNIERLNVEVEFNSTFEVYGVTKSGVKVDKEIPKRCNFAIINKEKVVPIKKIINSVAYFDNVYGEVTHFYPFYLNANIKPSYYKDNKIYFQDCRYKDIDIEAEYIVLKRIRFTVKESL